MKKLLCMILACLLLLPMFSCSNTSPRETTIRQVTTDNYGISYILEGPPPTIKEKDKYYPKKPAIILLDNNYIKAEIIGTFEIKYGKKGEKQIGRGASIQFTNKSPDDFFIEMHDAYIGDNFVNASNYMSPNACLSGKTIVIDFIFTTQNSVQSKPIDSLDEIELLEASIVVYRFIDKDNAEKLDEYPFSVS